MMAYTTSQWQRVSRDYCLSYLVCMGSEPASEWVSEWMNVVYKTRFPLFYWQKNPGLSRTPWKIFQDLFRARECLDIKKKRHLLTKIQSVVYCRKFSMKQNMLHYCCLLSTWTTRKMHDFQGYFSRTFQEAWEPWQEEVCGVVLTMQAPEWGSHLSARSWHWHGTQVPR